MARKSAISQLDPRIRDAVDSAIREGRATIEEILERVRAMGGQASRSSLGRYKKSAEEQMAKYREAQEVAKVWIARLEADPQGDVGRLLPEMLRAVAFQQLANMDGDEVDSKEIGVLARAIKDASSATKATVEAERLRRKIRDAAAKVQAVETEVREGKRTLDADTLKRIREEIYGIV